MEHFEAFFIVVNVECKHVENLDSLKIRIYCYKRGMESTANYTNVDAK